MPDRNWLDEFDVHDSELDELIKSASAELDEGGKSPFNLLDEAPIFEPYSVILATVLHVQSDALYLDIGFKDEVIVFARDLHLEVANFPKVGDKIEVGFLGFDASQQPRLTSEGRVSSPVPRPIPKFEEGDRVRGKVRRRMKGGFLFDFGIAAILPASQLDIRRPTNLDSYIGQELECEVIRVDRYRRIVVVSRRTIIEAERAAQVTALLRRIRVGDIVSGVVVDIVDFGAFVGLGGLNGLVHITDMGKESVKHPSELVCMGDEVEVEILHIDHDNDKIALALIRNMGPTEE